MSDELTNSLDAQIAEQIDAVLRHAVYSNTVATLVFPNGERWDVNITKIITHLRDENARLQTLVNDIKEECTALRIIQDEDEQKYTALKDAGDAMLAELINLRDNYGMECDAIIANYEAVTKGKP